MFLVFAGRAIKSYVFVALSEFSPKEKMSTFQKKKYPNKMKCAKVQQLSTYTFSVFKYL